MLKQKNLKSIESLKCLHMELKHFQIYNSKYKPQILTLTRKINNFFFIQQFHLTLYFPPFFLELPPSFPLSFCLGFAASFGLALDGSSALGFGGSSDFFASVGGGFCFLVAFGGGGGEGEASFASLI